MTASRAFVSADSVAVALGGDEVALALEERGIKVTRTGSRGASWAEPCVEVEQVDGTRRVYCNASAAAVRAGVTPFSGLTSAGTVDQLLEGQSRLIFENCGAHDPLSLDAYRAAGGFQNGDLSSVDLIEAVCVAGLRGRGGAGFPAHIKWRTVADTPSEEKWVVCNADEGDSGTFADRLLLEGDPFRLIDGMILAGRATGARRGVVYLRSEYPLAARTFHDALDLAAAAGLIGPDAGFELSLFVGAGAYICGEESSLLESLEGRRGEVRARPPLPAVAGLFGKPTLVHNVITLASVPWIAAHGGAAYARHGAGDSTGTMPFQISGNVARGGLVEIPFGLTLGELLERWAGGTRSGRPIRAVQIGGPLGAYLSPGEFDTPLTYEAMAQLGAGIGHGGIVVFDETVDLAEQAEYAFQFCANESCGKCTPCRVGAVRGVEVMREIRRGTGDVEVLEDLCDLMENASLCQMGGMTPIPVRSAWQRFPEDFRSEAG